MSPDLRRKLLLKFLKNIHNGSISSTKHHQLSISFLYKISQNRLQKPKTLLTHQTRDYAQHKYIFVLRQPETFLQGNFIFNATLNIMHAKIFGKIRIGFRIISNIIN